MMPATNANTAVTPNSVPAVSSSRRTKIKTRAVTLTTNMTSGSFVSSAWLHGSLHRQPFGFRSR